MKQFICILGPLFFVTPSWSEDKGCAMLEGATFISSESIQTTCKDRSCKVRQQVHFKKDQKLTAYGRFIIRDPLAYTCDEKTGALAVDVKRLGLDKEKGYFKVDKELPLGIYDFEKGHLYFLGSWYFRWEKATD